MEDIMKKFLTAGSTIALLALAAAPVSAADLKLLSSWNTDNWPTYAALDMFTKKVKSIGEGKVNISISGKEVVPPFEQLQPVSAGVFDMLYTHGIYHAGSKGIAFTMDAVAPGPKKRRDAGLIDYIDKYYQKHNNMKLLGLVANSNHGYHIFLKKPLTDGSFKGRKVRGTLSYHGVIRLLGGSPVVLPGGQIYTALEKGVIDGAAWPAAGMLTMKHYEVAKFKVRPTFGTTNTGFWINLAKWKTLTKAEQEVLIEAAKQTEIEMPAEGDRILAEESKTLEKFGVKETMLNAEMAAKVRATFSGDMWTIAQKCCSDGVKGLRALAQKAGLSN
jgi:TRAP-type transport system periplasmic protein